MNKKKILVAILVIAILASLIVGGYSWYQNRYSTKGEATQTAQKFLSMLYTPGKSTEAKQYASDELKKIKTDEDFTVVDGAAQKITKFKYDQKDQINENLIVLSGTFDSTQQSDSTTTEKLHNNFSVRMVKEGQSTGWKVDLYNVD
jgi:hypothetical protein